MSRQWFAIQQHMARLAPDIAASLNPPATAQDIARLQTALNLTLPPDFCAYLLTFNGQRHDNFTRGFYGSPALLPVEEMITTNQTLRGLPGDDAAFTGFRENKIRGVLWSEGWVAFASFQGSELFVLDLAPAANGTVRQIFAWYHGMDLAADDAVLADSFTAFSAALLQRLQAPDVTVDEEGTVWRDDDWY